MTLTPSGYAFLGLTAIVACLISILTFAVLRLAAAARDTRRSLRGSGGTETALLSAALQDAVTKLKAQERATAARAEASERLSDEIISSLTAGLLVVGLTGDIRILNPAGRRMLDLPDAAPPDECRRSLDELALWAVIDECLRALFTDLTAVKDLEEQLRLKDSLATVGELTAGIAHEFRNGLATIHGYSKLFDVMALPESYRAYVEGIRGETESLSQVVTNFLNFARPAQLTLTRVDLGAICERAADEIRADAQALGGDVEVRGEFGVIDGDEVLLRQAFSNLLRNALEACVGVASPPRIGIQSEIDRLQKVSRIAVTDNGPGIAPALRERVFRPFFTSKRNGTGLGLALVQKIIVFHNGRVVVSASPEGGASLQITLPTAS